MLHIIKLQHLRPNTMDTRQNITKSTENDSIQTTKTKLTNISCHSQTRAMRCIMANGKI